MKTRMRAITILVLLSFLYSNVLWAVDPNVYKLASQSHISEIEKHLSTIVKEARNGRLKEGDFPEDLKWLWSIVSRGLVSEKVTTGDGLELTQEEITAIEEYIERNGSSLFIDLLLQLLPNKSAFIGKIVDENGEIITEYVIGEVRGGYLYLWDSRKPRKKPLVRIRCKKEYVKEEMTNELNGLFKALDLPDSSIEKRYIQAIIDYSASNEAEFYVLKEDIRNIYGFANERFFCLYKPFLTIPAGFFHEAGEGFFLSNRYREFSSKEIGHRLTNTEWNRYKGKARIVVNEQEILISSHTYLRGLGKKARSRERELTEDERLLSQGKGLGDLLFGEENVSVSQMIKEQKTITEALRNMREEEWVKGLESEWLRKASTISLEKRMIKGEEITAKFIVDNTNFPEGLYAWHFRDEGTLVIVARGPPMDEIIYHEYREDYWMNQGISRREAHIFASAERVIAFSEGGRLTPYHKSQIENMTPAQLQDLINERRAYHYEIVKRYLGEDKLKTIINYEARLRIYPQLVSKMKSVYPDWELVSVDDLYNIRIGLISAMRIDGIIDEEDFEKIKAVGMAVEEVSVGTGLTDRDKILLTEAISITYLLQTAGLGKEFAQRLRHDLESLGYGSNASEIIMILRGLKKRLKRNEGVFKSHTDYRFVKKLGELLGYEIFDEIGAEGKSVRLCVIRDSGSDSLTKYWADIFESGIKQWNEIFDVFKGRFINLFKGDDGYYLHFIEALKTRYMVDSERVCLMMLFREIIATPEPIRFPRADYTYPSGVLGFEIVAYLLYEAEKRGVVNEAGLFRNLEKYSDFVIRMVHPAYLRRPPLRKDIQVIDVRYYPLPGLGDLNQSIIVARMLKRNFPDVKVRLCYLSEHEDDIKIFFPAYEKGENTIIEGIEIIPEDEIIEDGDIAIASHSGLINWDKHNHSPVQIVVSEYGAKQNVEKGMVYGPSITADVPTGPGLGLFLNPEVDSLKGWYDSLSEDERRKEKIRFIKRVINNYTSYAGIADSQAERIAECPWAFAYTFSESGFHSFLEAYREAGITEPYFMFVVGDESCVEETMWYLDFVRNGLNVILIDSLPHEDFIKLMLFCDLPYIVTGDGSLTEAMQIGKPYVYEVLGHKLGIEKAYPFYFFETGIGEEYGEENLRQKGAFKEFIQKHYPHYQRWNFALPSVEEKIVEAIRDCWAKHKARLDDARFMRLYDDILLRLLGAVIPEAFERYLLVNPQKVLEDVIDRLLTETETQDSQRLVRDNIATALNKLINEPGTDWLTRVLAWHSLFLKSLRNQDLIAQIGFSKIKKYMERGDMNIVLIPFETTTGATGKIKEIGVDIGWRYPLGTEIRFVPKRNRNYGWYIELYVWDEETEMWGKVPVRTILFLKGAIKLLDSRVSIQEYEWIDYIKEENKAIDGGVVRPGPYVVRVSKNGTINISEPNNIIFSAKGLAGKEVRIELFQHPVYGELIYIYDRNKYEWEQREIEKGICTELSPPISCYRKTGKGKFEKFPPTKGASFEQQLWVDWFDSEHGSEGYDPPEYVTKVDRGGQVQILSGKISFSVNMLRGKQALVKFVRDPRYKQFNPNGEFIFIYDKERYDRESFQIQMGIRQEHSLPDKVYIKTGKGKWQAVAEKISFSQLVWLDWMYAEDSEDVLRPKDPIYTHVPDSGAVTFVHYGEREIKFVAMDLAGRDAVVKLAKDQNFGDAIYIYDAVSYFKEEREIRDGIRETFSLPTVAYKKTGPGVYERIPKTEGTKTISDFGAYVWIEWVYQEIDKEIIRPIGEYVADCSDRGHIYIGSYRGKMLDFFSPVLKGKKVVIKLYQHPYYGELIYVYDAERYYMERIEMSRGLRKELSPPDACYKKEEKGECIPFPERLSINQKSWLDWWYGEPVKPMGELELRMSSRNKVYVAKYRERRVEFNVLGLVEGKEVVVRLVDNPDYGELVYIYEKETIQRNPHSSPIQVYRRIAPGIGEPLPGIDWDKLQKLTWLDYLYRRPNMYGAEVKPRGYSVSGWINNAGVFAFTAPGRKFRFYLKEHRDKCIQIIKDENPKFGYVFKVVLEEDQSRRPVAIYVRHPTENRLIEIQNHPDYQHGDENLTTPMMERDFVIHSEEELVSKLITLAKWIDYWGLRELFESTLQRFGITVNTYTIRMEERHHLLDSMGLVFANLMREGMNLSDALSRVINKYMDKIKDYEICDVIFESKAGQDFLNDEEVRFAYISDGKRDKTTFLNVANYVRQHSHLKKSEYLEPPVDYAKLEKPNLVVVDLTDPLHRAKKMDLLKGIYDYLPVHSFLIVLQRTSEKPYMKTVAQVMSEQGFITDTIEHTDIHCIVSGFKERERITEEEVVTNISDDIRNRLSDKEIYQRNEIVEVIEMVLREVRLGSKGLSKLASGLVSTNDPVLIARLLEYLNYHKEQYRFDRDRYPHMPMVIGPGEIEFVFCASSDTEVLVAGDFTGWGHSPILLTPKGPIGPDGKQRYSVRVKDLYGVHYFKYIVNGQWYENLNSVSPYKETSAHHGHIVTNSVVWSTRNKYDTFVKSLVSNLLKRLDSESISEDLKKRIALMLPLSFVPTDVLKKPDNAKRLIKYTLSNIEGLSTGALAIQLELILKYFSLSEEDLFNLGHELAGETLDIGLLYFLLDYLRYNTTSYDAPRDRYYQAPIIHDLGSIEFVRYAPEGSEVVIIGDFTAWEDRPISLVPNPVERRDGLIRYSVKINGLYGPHLFKFKIKNPGENRFYWYDDVDPITPYIKEETYGPKNCVVWSYRSKSDPLIKGLSTGFFEKVESQDTQDFYKCLIIENFPLINYPEFSGEILEEKERVNERLWLAGKRARGPPSDTLQQETLLYVSLRNFAEPEHGLNGINGFIEWYRKYLAQALSSDRQLFSTVMFIPPFEIGQIDKLGAWGSPWATKSFDNIDPRIGTKEELIAGIRRLREEFGLRVMFDIVLHSVSNDNAILTEHPDWGIPRAGPWQTDWKDIVPLDLRKPEVRQYLFGQLIRIKETYNIDGFRIDGVSQTHVFLLSAYEYLTSELRKRYPDILLVAEGRDPFLLNTAQVIYNWDIAFSLKKCLERGAITGYFIEAILRKQIYGNYEKRGLLMSFSRTQDSKFEMGRPHTVKALLFTIPESVPALWMPQICKGVTVGEGRYKDIDRQIKFEGFLVTEPKEDIEFIKRLINIRNENPVLVFGNLGVITPAYCSNPNEVIIFRRDFGSDSVCIIGGVTNAHYKIDLQQPFHHKDLSGDPEETEYWVGDLITGKGIKIGKAELEEIMGGRRRVRVVLTGDNPVYLSAERWDPERHFLSEKQDPSRIMLLGRLPCTTAVDSASVETYSGIAETRQKVIAMADKELPTADCFYRYFGGDRQRTELLWDKLRSSVQKAEIKIIDASALVYFDSEKKKVYPRSLDFKLGISKLKEKLQDLKIVIVNVDERYTASEIIRALDIGEAGDFASVLDMKGNRNFRVDVLEFINRHFGKEYKGSNLTIAYYHENRSVFRKTADARFIEVLDADNKTTFISGLGVLLSVLMEDKEFMDGLPYEIQQELRKVLIGKKDGAELFIVSSQPMTEEYYKILTEEHRRIDQSV